MDRSADTSPELRHQRDRFVAFAFAAADVLIEVDADQVIHYAGGAIQSLTGKSPQRLVGGSCLDLVAPADRPFVRAALAMASRRKRFGPVNVRLTGALCGPVLVALYGASLPQRNDRTFLALRVAAAGQAAEAATGLETRGKLLDRETFAKVAGDVAQGRTGLQAANQITLLTLGGLEELTKRLDGDVADELMGEIVGQLQASSLDGAAAGRLDREKFGFVHDADLDASAVEALIEDCARRADPSGRGVALSSTTIALAGDELTETDKAKALVYAINKYAEAHSNFDIGELSEGYRQMAAETLARIRTFRRTIAEGSVDVLYQPIVGIKDRKLHHYEALARLRSGGPEASPARFIQFAEEASLIGEFDLMMCRKIIEKMMQARDHNDRLRVAVNISTRTLENPALVEELVRLLARSAALRDDLMFEITESWKIVNLEAAANVILGIRERGFPICLDDFGAGSTTFQYLRALEVDYVKIDGMYVRESLTRTNGRTFLKAMATLCRDLGVKTVGEMVETEEMAALLAEAGVVYGQGYLFGRPMPGALSAAA
jgi:EAL domain-containing protein (putative c-di-GMP-specific phosphodiesterase class I)